MSKKQFILNYLTYKNNHFIRKMAINVGDCGSTYLPILQSRNFFCNIVNRLYLFSITNINANRKNIVFTSDGGYRITWISPIAIPEDRLLSLTEASRDKYENLFDALPIYRQLNDLFTFAQTGSNSVELTLSDGSNRLDTRLFWNADQNINPVNTYNYCIERDCYFSLSFNIRETNEGMGPYFQGSINDIINFLRPHLPDDNITINMY